MNVKIPFTKERQYMRMGLVIISQRQQKMHNLGELKSRQFFRRPSIEPIARASSFHTIDNRRHERIHKMKNKQFQNQNIIDLANIMHQIQQLKPKTAHLIEQNKINRNRRAETIVPSIPKLKSKNNLMGIIDLLKEQRQSRGQFKNLNKIQQKAEQKINRRIAIERKNHDKNLDLKRKSGQGHECHVNFQTIKFPQGVCRIDDKELVQKTDIERRQELQQVEQNYREELPKNMTEYGFRPQHRLTINNIDKLIFLNSKERRSPNTTKRLEKDTIKLNQQQKPVFLKQLLEIQQESMPIVYPKSKKLIASQKVPQFIKASLQAYKQQSEYSNFITKTSQNKTVGHRDDQPPAPQRVQNAENINQLNDIQVEQKRSEQNLLGAKLNLLQKQKRKSSKIIDYIRERRQNNTIAVQSSKPIFKTSRQKQKKSYVEDDFNHKICGWEENEVPSTEPIDFKI